MHAVVGLKGEAAAKRCEAARMGHLAGAFHEVLEVHGAPGRAVGAPEVDVPAAAVEEVQRSAGSAQAGGGGESEIAELALDRAHPGAVGLPERSGLADDEVDQVAAAHEAGIEAR